ncbi:pyridoxal phosphate-dependent decarboxylase family protein [Occallatibacter riparius]|uniref:Aminotransferase class V-fold PLP-dependent enzyme n=1 Tax=Occallatibacter riparius TaxID=1002689 RepID=A0A9J7BVC0_9BACT|nr:aminotransferase class V-fold PLP-dependent enzyme [Occallatibacter riparius]UWZ84957.1 aminotransferase class V-fold PLP-dependent enzyme [Occallatibacter riparius]
MRSLILPAGAFRALAHHISDFTADYLEKLPNLPSYPPGVSGQQTQALFTGDLPLEGIGAAAFADLERVFNYARPSSPRFFGYVFGSGEPISALGDFAAGVLNQNATAWRSAPAGVTIERTVVRWLAEAIGCAGFSGSLTLGGSSANLMALCMAREAKAPANQSGVRGGVIYCSAEAHMSIAKAAALLGLGHDSVRKIAVDEAFRMRTKDLRAAIERDLREGKQPIAIVGSAGTTATGSIDPLDEVADLCAEFGLWMHVDGAYGALAALAIPDAFRGMNRADSLSLDPHKWLYQPAGVGCLLYRNPADAQRAFSHTGDYARSLTNDPIEGFAIFEESMELSRPFRALKLWMSLRYFGLRAFQHSIAEDLELAQVLARAIDAEPHLERLAPVALSAVCFRFKDSNGDLDVLNQAILQRVTQRGRVYLSNAVIHSQFVLRACIVNHRTTEDDVREIVAEVLAAAGEVQA